MWKGRLTVLLRDVTTSSFSLTLYRTQTKRRVRACVCVCVYSEAHEASTGFSGTVHGPPSPTAWNCDRLKRPLTLFIVGLASPSLLHFHFLHGRYVRYCCLFSFFFFSTSPIFVALTGFLDPEPIISPGLFPPTASYQLRQTRQTPSFFSPDKRSSPFKLKLIWNSCCDSDIQSKIDLTIYSFNIPHVLYWIPSIAAFVNFSLVTSGVTCMNDFYPEISHLFYVTVFFAGCVVEWKKKQWYWILRIAWM